MDRAKAQKGVTFELITAGFTTFRAKRKAALTGIRESQHKTRDDKLADQTQQIKIQEERK